MACLRTLHLKTYEPFNADNENNCGQTRHEERKTRTNINVGRHFVIGKWIGKGVGQLRSEGSWDVDGTLGWVRTGKGNSVVREEHGTLATHGQARRKWGDSCPRTQPHLLQKHISCQKKSTYLLTLKRTDTHHTEGAAVVVAARPFPSLPGSSRPIFLNFPNIAAAAVPSNHQHERTLAYPTAPPENFL